MLRQGICEKCWKPREVQSLWDAWVVLRSGFGSHLEWCEAANLFYSHGLEVEAEHCSLNAIQALGRLPGAQPLSWRTVISIYVRGKLSREAISHAGKVNFERLANRLSETQESIRLIRSQRLESKKSTSVLSEVDVALAESIMLSRDTSKYSRLQLAAKFRKYSSNNKKFRWGRPDVALGIIDDLLIRHPGDIGALCVKASALGDLEKWDDSIAIAQEAHKLSAENVVVLRTLGRALLGKRQGLLAWEPIYKSFLIQKDLPSAAMLLISCALASEEKGLKLSDINLIADRRASIKSLIDGLPELDEKSGKANLNRITLNFLIFDNLFVEAIKFLDEIVADGHEINISYWTNKINGAILRSGKKISEIRETAANVRVDLYPEFPTN